MYGKNLNIENDTIYGTMVVKMMRNPSKIETDRINFNKQSVHIFNTANPHILRTSSSKNRMVILSLDSQQKSPLVHVGKKVGV